MKYVKLREESLNYILQSKGLPLKVDKASINELNLNVPWASLNTKPIFVTVVGL
jgi:hypothetical protein